MKLNTLLLSSAAVLVAGPAFAADLPSKKAAPASAVTACKVGDTTGFTLPGTETCFKINGRVTVDFATDSETRKSEDGNADFTNAKGGFRINFDALTNTEIGVVRSFGRIDGGDVAKAYVQFSGITAGLKDSLTDIYGTTGNKPTQAGNSDANGGIDYQIKAGAVGFGIGLENGADNNTSGAGDRPNIVGQVSVSAGPLTAKIAAASHQSYDATAGVDDGYAVKGALSASLGQFNLIAFGGTAEGASAYIGGASSVKDLTAAGVQSESTSFGGEINTKLGDLTVALLAAQYENKSGAITEELDEYGVYASYAIAKGLTVQPEYYRLSGVKDSNIFQVRIQRDF